MGHMPVRTVPLWTVPAAGALGGVCVIETREECGGHVEKDWRELEKPGEGAAGERCEAKAFPFQVPPPHRSPLMASWTASPPVGVTWLPPWCPEPCHSAEGTGWTQDCRLGGRCFYMLIVF